MKHLILCLSLVGFIGCTSAPYMESWKDGQYNVCCPDGKRCKQEDLISLAEAKSGGSCKIIGEYQANTGTELKVGPLSGKKRLVNTTASCQTFRCGG